MKYGIKELVIKINDLLAKREKQGKSQNSLYLWSDRTIKTKLLIHSVVDAGDVLLIEDIHQMEDVSLAKEAFLRVYERRTAKGKKIIMTGNCSPSEQKFSDEWMRKILQECTIHVENVS